MDLKALLKSAKEELMASETILALNEIKAKYLGKKSFLTEIMQNMKDLSHEERKELGQKTNEFKEEFQLAFEEKVKKINLEEINKKLGDNKIDITMPGFAFNEGALHPLTKVKREIEDLFLSLGYEIKDGPEVETDKFNFELLNIPSNHPARDMHDSFYFDAKTLLRTHTSPVQVRTMLERPDAEELRLICPGKAYRRDLDDATHSHQFMQIEGLVLGANVTLSNLKGTLEMLAKALFGKDRIIRLRPSYFPFTEPSVEMDVSCGCEGKGCNICKNTGFIEVLGAGLVNEKVLLMSGYDPKKIRGFAFGLGLERCAMLKYGINDIRHFYTNDLRFLKQFKVGL